MSDPIIVIVTEPESAVNVVIQDAPDAYQIAVAEGFTGTRAEWVARTVLVDSPQDGDMIQREGGSWITRTLEQIKSALGLGAAAYLNTGTSDGQIPVLGSGGKLSVGVLPALSLTETLPVDNQAARLALTASQAQGKLVVDADTGKSWGLVSGGDPATAGDWVQIGDRDIDWSDVQNKPDFGSAALADTGDFATSAQGALADSAMQPGDIVVLTLAEYQALAPEVQMDGRFYVIPTT